MSNSSFSFNKETALDYFSKGFNSFLERKKTKVPKVAKEVGLKNSSVYTWKAGLGFPYFQALFKLFKMGMTLRELFGDEIEKTERMNRLIVETEEMKKILSLWRKSSFSETSVEIEKEIANLNNKIDAILVRIHECK